MALQHYMTRAERVTDTLVHVVGVCGALVGGPILVTSAFLRGGLGPASAVLIYSLCLVTMLAVSAAYNLATNAALQQRLRRFDHAAIFLMIAGSYTPFTTQSLDGAWAMGMTIAVWSLAILGATGKLLLPGTFKRLWVVVYVLLGWLVIVAIRPVMDALSTTALILLVAGGAIYTLGALIYAAPQLPLRRAIWHGFVLVGAGAHYAAILIGVVLA
jgi:hemolysin III